MAETEVLAELEPADDELEPPPEPMPATEQCSTRTIPTDAIEITDPDDPRGGRLLTPTSDGVVRFYRSRVCSRGR